MMNTGDKCLILKQKNGTLRMPFIIYVSDYGDLAEGLREYFEEYLEEAKLTI